MQLLRRFSFFVACASACAWLASCAAPASTDTDMPSGKVIDGGICSPGETKSCACLGSTSNGKRTCGDNGKYGDCAPCEMGGSTGTPGTSGSTAGKCGACNGCCDGTSCVEFGKQDDGHCGGKGKNCVPCNGSATCDTSVGKCSTSSGGSCGAGCTGCCSAADGCVAYEDTDFSACGANGSACKACNTPGGLCTDAGQCTNQVAYYDWYEFSIRRVDESGSGCSSYSATGESNPDPFVCVYAWDESTKAVALDYDGMPAKGCSTACSSTGNCMRSINEGLLRRESDNLPAQFPGQNIIDGTLLVEVWDYDYGSSDLVGKGTFPKVTTLSDSMLNAGPYSNGSSCSVPVVFQIAYEF